MNENETKEENTELIEYRLSNIEKSLAKMETLLSANQMQDRDIKELQEKNVELVNAYNAHEQRIKKLEEAPLRQKADRWTQVIDIIFKLFLTACACIVFAKIGLN